MLIFVDNNSLAMKILLDIKDDKVNFMLELLRSFSFVKAETISSEKADFLKELKGSVNEVASSKKGKTKLKSADQLLNEL